MLVKILGGIDIFSGLILIFSGAGVFAGQKILIFFGFLLLIKSLVGFLKDFASWIDLISGLVLISLLIFPWPGFILIILGILVAQKGLFSFV